MKSWKLRSALTALLLQSAAVNSMAAPAASSAPPAAFDGREPIPEAECRRGSFDFTNHFPPVANQGSQGQCFAFAATALLDENVCVSSEGKCGETRFSPIDAARDYPDKVDYLGRLDFSDPAWNRDFSNLGNNNQGGQEFEVLNAALDFGVCEERLAPWFPRLETSCKGMEDRSSCVIEGLKRQWRKYHRATRGKTCDGSSGAWSDSTGAPLSDAEISRIEKIAEKAQSYLQPPAESGLDLSEELRTARSEFDFVQSVLIPPKCRENRTLFGGTAWHDDWTEDLQYQNRETKQLPDGTVSTTISPGERTHETHFSNAERFQRLTERVAANQRSVALGLCSKSAEIKSRSRQDDPRDPSLCGPHAVVANGIRWNPEKNRCEIHIRNSWGDSNRLRDWIAVEPVLNSTFRISGIEP